MKRIFCTLCAMTLLLYGVMTHRICDGGSQ